MIVGHRSPRGAGPSIRSIASAATRQELARSTSKHLRLPVIEAYRRWCPHRAVCYRVEDRAAGGDPEMRLRLGGDVGQQGGQPRRPGATPSLVPEAEPRHPFRIIGDRSGATGPLDHRLLRREPPCGGGPQERQRPSAARGSPRFFPDPCRRQPAHERPPFPRSCRRYRERLLRRNTGTGHDRT